MALYAISYDDQEVLREFSEKQSIPYPLLSDVDSEVIRAYGILNDQVKPGDLILYGIPYPGTFITDGDGVVVSKSFHGSYKIRDSPEALLDAALGRAQLDHVDAAPAQGDEAVRVQVALRGGRGTLRQGIVRHAIARFELTDGFHLYGDPVPEGMIATRVEVSGPPGLVVHDPVLPPTEPLRLASMGVELQVWSGSFDIEVPFHAVGELASECRPLDRDSVPLEVSIRYQACDDETCLLPKTETFRFDVPLDVVDIPKLAMHTGHGQREGNFDAQPHLQRLLKRKFKESPLGFLRHAALAVRLNIAARLRARRGESKP